MKILLACEESAVVTSEFAYDGYHAVMSCDLLPSRCGYYYHYQGDVFDLINSQDRWQFDMMIAFPPCQYLCSSGLHHNKGDRDRQQKTEYALDFVQRLMDAPINRISIENSIGCISTRIRKPDQIIQPHQFGHDASKATCLWLKNLPELNCDRFTQVEPRIVNGKRRWANQTDSGQNRLGPSKDRSQIRATTYRGIAQAMHEQWGSL